MAIGAAIGGLFFKNWLGGAAAGLTIQFILLMLLSGAYSVAFVMEQSESGFALGLSRDEAKGQRIGSSG